MPAQHAQHAASLHQRGGSSATALPRGPGWSLGLGADSKPGAGDPVAAGAAAAAVARSPAVAGAVAAGSRPSAAQNSCGCCIDLTCDESDDDGGSDVLLMEALGVAPVAFASGCTNQHNGRRAVSAMAALSFLLPAAAISGVWTCSQCTLQNSAKVVACAACDAPSPQLLRAAAGETAPAAGAQHWACGLCTCANGEGASHCSACGSWRFARDLPVAGRAGSS